MRRIELIFFKQKHSTATWVKPLFEPKNFVTPKSLLNPPDSRLVSKELEVLNLSLNFSSLLKILIVPSKGNSYGWLSRLWEKYIRNKSSRIQRLQMDQPGHSEIMAELCKATGNCSHCNNAN